MENELTNRRRNQVRKSTVNEIAGYLRARGKEDAAEMVDEWIEDWAEE